MLGRGGERYIEGSARSVTRAWPARRRLSSSRRRGWARAPYVRSRSVRLDRWIPVSSRDAVAVTISRGPVGILPATLQGLGRRRRRDVRNPGRDRHPSSRASAVPRRRIADETTSARPRRGAEQSVQTHPRRRDALLRQLLRPDSRALQLERLAVPIEVGGQDLAFIADQPKGDPAVHGAGLRIVLRRNVGHGASMPNRRLVLAVSVAGYLLPSKPM